MSVVKPKPKLSQRPMKRKEIPLGTNENSKPPQAQKNAGAQVVFIFSFASDWLKMWHEFSEPVT